MPRPRASKLSTPYLRRVWLDQARIENHTALPFSLPIFEHGFDLEFDRAVTIIIGESGVGTSTLIEGIAVLAGCQEAGDGRRAIDRAPAADGERLAQALRPTWQPRIAHGWFFPPRALFSLSRYVVEPPFASDAMPPDYPPRSSGEAFVRFVEERRQRQGIFVFDTPEAVLSPSGQLEFLKLLRRMEASCQVIMATHSPLLMALPGARLLRFSGRGLRAVTLEATDDFRLLLGFCTNPRQFVRTALEE
jgi:predicted ATPase